MSPPQRQLRIAVDARPLAFPKTGIGRYTASILSEFARCLPGREQLQLFLYSDRPLTLPFELPRSWKLRQGSVDRRALSTPFAQLVFPLWSLRDGVEVFWSPRHHLPLLLPRKIRQVVTIHDVVWKRFPETMNRGGRFVESLLMPSALRRADRAIAVSNFTKQEIGELFAVASETVDVIYEASSLPTGRRQAATATERPYFLFVGSSEPRKNLRRLMNAYVAYRERVACAADIVLVGSHAWGDFDVEQFIAANKLHQYARLMNSVSDDSLADLYCGALALLMPSLYEGFGLPLVEAMQAGLPIVTATTSAMPEVAGDAALLVDPLSEPEIRDALCRLTSDDELRNRLAERSNARGQQFSWESAADQTRKTLESCGRNRREAVKGC